MSIQTQVDWLKSQAGYQDMDLASAREAYKEQHNSGNKPGKNLREKAWCLATGKPEPVKASKSSKAFDLQKAIEGLQKDFQAKLEQLGDEANAHLEMYRENQSCLDLSLPELVAAWQSHHAVSGDES